MDNSAKNKLKALAAHTLFLTCAGALLMFRASSGTYFEKIRRSIFITAYTECRGEEELDALKNKIEAVEGVKKTVILTEDEVFTALEGSLTKKDILLSIGNIKIPSLCKIYPYTLNYEKLRKISDTISAFSEIKYSDTGGKAVKGLFIFAEDFQKAVIFITALLLLGVLSSALAAAKSMKYLSERFHFLSERGIAPKNIVLQYAVEMFLIPLTSLIVSILILLAFRQSNCGNIITFLTAPQIILLIGLSALPAAARAAARLIKSA
ncbi:hypothetical protein FP828_00870 [bacterium]|nr:hypothetical protein [bacterium]